ncbi:hypothetical protein [Paractinoplanes lichenicola]|uniref:Uncharacterized protein n=1 Tax=Paractinoplanes lichenicola TaxID=2802976 RepID=A0ABS1VXL1_9ACTN|nr:hypothetical protein [Actinoplanes lichenicola]MBL7259235.1 hypothetical protein [Actinoplanes lichenicola]
MSAENTLGPVPSPDLWQEQVRTAMNETDENEPRLRWTRRDKIRWDLHGDCPRCRDYMSSLVSNVIATDAVTETGRMIEILAECSCEPGHTQGSRGCGAGRGAYIYVPAPVA